MSRKAQRPRKELVTMNDSLILLIGLFAFSMTVVGVVLTVREFRSNVHPQEKWDVPRHADRIRT